MIKLTDEQISDIAQELEIGMVCYVHKETGELKSHPDEMMDEELWEEVIDEIDRDSESYIRIEGMDSRESYRLMERFIDTVEDKQLALRLSNAINVSKPFHNFRYELDYSDEYLNKWYAFKSNQMVEWVKDQINLEMMDQYDGDDEYDEEDDEDESNKE